MSVDWFEKARRFFNSAELNFKNGLYDIASFSAHQAVEMLLKGLIVKKTGSKPFTHSLVELYEILETIDIKFSDEIKSCLRTLTRHYTQSRYPDARIIDYDMEEAEEALNCMKKVFNYVESLQIFEGER